MARKTKSITIPAPVGEARANRDTGKTFLLTEMSAMRAEKWAQRALLAVAASGIDIPPEVIRMGVGAVAAVGMRALMTMAFQDAEPLLDEMMTCIVVVPDRREPTITRPLDPDDIEEVSTLLLLRSEVVELHTGFSLAAFLSSLGKAATSDQNTKATETSPSLSETSSEPAAQP